MSITTILLTLLGLVVALLLKHIHQETQPNIESAPIEQHQLWKLTIGCITCCIILFSASLVGANLISDTDMNLHTEDAHYY